MEYTIKQLANLAGVTTRTLRWYHQQGLLKPCRTSGSGYRIYGAAEVDRLQQILFYRELGLELAEIGSLLSAPGFDRQVALQSHLVALRQRQARLEALILTVEKTLKGDDTMSDKEKFDGFKKQALEKNEQAYGQEIRQKYGEETVEKSNKLFANLSQEQFDEMNRLAVQIQTRLEAAVAGGFDPAGEEGLALGALHRQWLGFTWPSYSPQAHVGLGEMYVDDQRFTAYYDEKQPGCAAFLQAAIAAYAAAL